jgi:MFS transporter, FHS family, L-fucose permease
MGRRADESNGSAAALRGMLPRRFASQSEADTMSTTARNAHGRMALYALTSLFFMWGLITSLNDILIPHLKGAFALNYVQAMLIQFCFFGAYFVMSLPAGKLVERIGYQRGIMLGLATAAVGCLLFVPAAGARVYGFFLGALFVLASGITLLQVAANPYVAVLGPPETASSRLTLTQAFNSLGTTVGPLLGSALILSATSATDVVREAQSVQKPYLGLAATLVLLAVAVALLRLPRTPGEQAPSAAPPSGGEASSVWQYRHLVLGAVAIFVYVGAEVAIGSFLVNLMHQPQIAGLDEQVAGRYLSLYWGGAMVGRFIGAAVMQRVRPGTVLAFNAIAAVVLLTIAMAFSGKVAMWSLLAIGLCNSIMFPTIFTLGIDGLGRHTGAGSGVLCMAIVGGALVPVLQGYIADHAALLVSFIVPAACYAYIAWYGASGHRHRLAGAAAPAMATPARSGAA